MGPALSSERAQGTVEYVGLLLALAALTAGLLAAAVEAPGAGLARTIAGKLVCAVERPGRCGGRESELVAAYGADLAATLRRQVPAIGFETGEFSSLPTDFRRCRDRSCADTSATGTVRRSHGGIAPTAFTHVVDCRGPAPSAGADCSGSRAGNLYLQYWLYYPDSATRPLGRLGYHRDDWESFQVRVAADGSHAARASSHGGYNGGPPGLRNAISDAGHSRSARWGPGLGHLHVAAGSHAGAPAYDGDDARRVPAGAVRLVPLEPIVGELGDERFEVAPPWEKAVWRDPESGSTG